MHPLCKRRKELHLLQADVAKLSSVRQATISRIETGRHLPSVDVAKRIALAVGISEMHLLYPKRYGFERTNVTPINGPAP